MSDNKKKRSTSKFYPQKKRMKNNSLSKKPLCKCGGGQSCIVDRRSVGDWVHEDDVFLSAGLPLRKNCMQPYYENQEEALKNFMTQPMEYEQLSLLDRWTEDLKSTNL